MTMDLALRDILAGDAPLVVIAPHPDDESLGCGALLAHAFAGRGAHVICVTDGSASHPNSRVWSASLLADQRWAELVRAVQALGGTAQNITWLGLPDAGLSAIDPDILCTRLLSAILDCGGRHVFAPAMLDHHADHKAVAQCATRLQQVRPDLAFYAYPVWSRWDTQDFPATAAAFNPFFLFPGRFAGAKRAAVDAHQSQLGMIVSDDPAGFTLDPAFIKMFVTQPEIFWRM
jgi:LmbE family N-acetylglucosaminyl deacetylase